MQLDSIRELKQELVDPARPPRTFTLATELSVPAGHPGVVATPRPSLALGVTPNGAGDFRLAVRVQHHALLGSAALGAIVTAARGEADVRFIGPVGKGTPWQRERRRPVQPGLSVGHHAITAGSLGAIVRLDDGARGILSNNHVLADEDRGRVGDAVIQPGAADGGSRGPDTIGALEAAVALDLTGVNLVDAAVARLDDGIGIDCAHLEGAPQPSACCRPEDVVDVAKIGRTTGLTFGRITAFEVDNVVVSFEAGLLRFDDQIEISGVGTSFSAGGDSGSLIVDAHTRLAVGLLFAGSERGGDDDLGVTFANPIETVLAALAVELDC